MSYRKISSFIFFVFFALTICGAAQSPGKILSAGEQSIGRRESFAKLSNPFQKTGTITRLKDERVQDVIRRRQKRRIFIMSNLTLTALKLKRAITGNQAGGAIRATVCERLTGNASSDFQAETYYRNNLWLNYKKDKSKITTGGKVNINGKSTNAVILTTAKNVQIKLYFRCGNQFISARRNSGGRCHKNL